MQVEQLGECLLNDNLVAHPAGLIRPGDERVVVVCKQADLAGAVQVDRDLPHQVPPDLGKDFRRKLIEIALVFRDRQDVGPALVQAPHAQQNRVAAVVLVDRLNDLLGIHQSVGSCGRTMSLRE